MDRYGWNPYVPAAARRAAAQKQLAKLRRSGVDIQPVEIEGRKIARTFWGAAWCDHLEALGDYANRLPRGRTYVRNGSVCHLDIARGRIDAMVSGSALYTVSIDIKTLPGKNWENLKKRCAGQIGSILELLQGRLSENVMAVVTERTNGLFPQPGEIIFHCSCPDWAVMCKHVAAVLYGVGARLDRKPELLFLLRGVDHQELISIDIETAAADDTKAGRRRRIADDALADVFGIEMSEDEGSGTERSRPESSGTHPEQAESAAHRKKRAAASKAGLTIGNTGSAAVPDEDSCTGGEFTGAAVAGLREKLGMSQIDFAELLGVSTASVRNWERNRGPLHLQNRTIEALNVAQRLTKRQAEDLLNRNRTGKAAVQSNRSLNTRS